MSGGDATLPIGHCKRRLLVLWLALGLTVLLLLLVRTMTGRFGSDDPSVVGTIWGWFLPNIVPVMMLMVGVVVADDIKRRALVAEGKPIKEEHGSAFLYRVALALSVLHLLTLICVILYDVMSTELNMIELTAAVGYFTAMSQGLVAATLGAFFSKA